MRRSRHRFLDAWRHRVGQGSDRRRPPRRDSYGRQRLLLRQYRNRLQPGQQAGRWELEAHHRWPGHSRFPRHQGRLRLALHRGPRSGVRFRSTVGMASNTCSTGTNTTVSPVARIIERPALSLSDGRWQSCSGRPRGGALEWSRPGDVLLLPVHGLAAREVVLAMSGRVPPGLRREES